MNRFIIEFNVEDIAKSLCDQHIVKMPLEEAQKEADKWNTGQVVQYG